MSIGLQHSQNYRTYYISIMRQRECMCVCDWFILYSNNTRIHNWIALSHKHTWKRTMNSEIYTTTNHTDYESKVALPAKEVPLSINQRLTVAVNNGYSFFDIFLINIKSKMKNEEKKQQTKQKWKLNQELNWKIKK